MRELKTGIDKKGKGNRYFEVGNIRVTSLPNTWGNCPGIRIQAYKKGSGKALHQGAELPVPDNDVAYGLIAAIVAAIDVA